MGEERNPAANALRHRNIERAATQVINEKDAIRPPLSHHRHHGGDRLLHERDAADASLLCG